MILHQHLKNLWKKDESFSVHHYDIQTVTKSLQ